MTVKQLIEQLSKYPENMDVYVGPRQTEFTYGLVNGVYKHSICMTEDAWDIPDDPPMVEVIIIDEE